MDDLYDRNEWIILKSCLTLMQIGNSSAFKTLKEYGIDINDFSEDSFKRVRSAIGRLNTRINLKHSGVNPESNEEKHYAQSVIQISNILGRNIDKDLITISEWIFLNKEVQRKIKTMEGNTWQS